MIKYIKRLLYLGYYIKTTDWKRYRKFLNFVVTNYSKTKYKLIFDSVISSIKYNISLEEYFMFFFWRERERERVGQEQVLCTNITCL